MGKCIPIPHFHNKCTLCKFEWVELIKTSSKDEVIALTDLVFNLARERGFTDQVIDRLNKETVSCVMES